MAEKVFTTQEAADHLRLKVRTVRKYIQAGIIKGIKIGTEWRVLDSDLQAYLDGLRAERDGEH